MRTDSNDRLPPAEAQQRAEVSTLLRSRNLPEHIVEDFAACGVVGEERGSS